MIISNRGFVTSVPVVTYTTVKTSTFSLQELGFLSFNAREYDMANLKEGASVHGHRSLQA